MKQRRNRQRQEREQIQIPEVFLRAMEEYGQGGGDRDRTTGGPSFPARRGCAWWIIPLVILAVLFLGFEWFIVTYSEWLWFGELGYQEVFLKEWSYRVGSFLIFFAVAASTLLFNWHLALGAARPSPRVANEGWQGFLSGGLRWVVTGLALVLAYLFATAGSSQWEEFLRYVYRVPFGQNDPIFGRDISFYLFDLPLINFLRGWSMALLFFSIPGVIILYTLSEWKQLRDEPARLLEHSALRRHVAVLLGLFLLLWAAGHWLGQYNPLYTPGGVVFGAGYTDLAASRLGLRVQAVLMGVVALTVLFNVVRAAPRAPLLALGLWFVAGVVLGGIYPGIVQRYQVEPNELARERPYILHNINATLLAYGLDDIQRNPLEVTNLGISEAELESNQPTLQNIRLWDYRPLLQTYAQLQSLRPYYQFNDVDIDRYTVDGELRQVMLSARELQKEGFSNPTWVNQTLQFTHGYGLVMNPVDQVTAEGLREFFIRDLPPVTTIDIEITRPELYYGELTDDVVFVNSAEREFNYPSGDQNVYTSYEGTGGVPLGGFPRRLLYALRFGEFNVLLSDYITPETRVMYHREITGRAARITPFLEFDEDPYLVVSDEGRLVWVIDAYTLSDRYPYSTPVPDGEFNYIRNAAKVTIDAYNGKVNYYLAAPGDPLVQAYSRAFPGLFQPMEAMPEFLKAHLRYPEGLFNIQTQQYLTYHMREPQVFYNKEDIWEIPQELAGTELQPQPIEPYYVISALPNSEEIEFLLIQPFVPRGKDNMVAWIAARNDPAHYGELVVYELPKQELVYGPLQIESRIDQDPLISRQLSLWSQRGSQVIRGNLLVIPIGDGFLYVEPLYLQSATSGLPELKRVILASGSRNVMRETLTDALTALVDEEPAVDVVVAEPPVSDGGEQVEGGPAPEDGVAPANPDATVDDLILSANQHFEAAQAAQQQGDWATYGRELESLEADLARMLELSGGVPPTDISTEP